MTLPLPADEVERILTGAGALEADELRHRALEALLRDEPELRLLLGVERYRRGGITLLKGADIAGVGFERFKEALHERGVEIRRFVLPLEEERRLARELAGRS